MYRTEDRRRVIEMRLKGMSYSQIRSVVSVSKSTLSLWLKDYPLTAKQTNLLNNLRKEKLAVYKEYWRNKREADLEMICAENRHIVGKLSKRDILMVGIGLYWGEGRKGGRQISISNTDPGMIRFYLKWLSVCFGVDKNNKRLRFLLHIYSDMNYKEERAFWTQKLGINESQFTKPYIKKSKLTNLDSRGFGHGTCMVYYTDAKMKTLVRAYIRLLNEQV